MMKVEIAPRLKRPALTDHITPIAAVLACAIALAAGWGLFVRRLLDRAERAQSSAGDVARIWGGPLQQPQPQIRWKRSDAATIELATGEIASTEVAVALDASYRRRGVAEYPGYEARFTGKYRFDNPSASSVSTAFAVGLPVDRSALMLSDLKLLIDGKEDPRTEYAADRILWTGELAAGKSAIFTLEYRARGLERFGYVLSPQKAGESTGARPVTNFVLGMTVNGAHGTLDYPVGSMAPTIVETAAGGAQHLVWKVDRVLTSFDIGVVIPDTSSVAGAYRRLIGNAPWFYLMFAGALLWSLATIGRRARTLHIIGLSGAYFLYFPLATYLVAYVPWPIASTATTLAISGLAVAHVSRFVGARASMRVALSLVFFLAVPAAAYLVPSHTGLILVLADFVALAIGLHALGITAKRWEDDDAETARAIPRPIAEEVRP
jgi:hypothetical protein